MTTTALAGVVMIALIFVTLAVGFPIGLSIGIGSAAAVYIIMPNAGSMMVSAQKMFQSVNSFALLAIPFFVLAGNLMNFGGIARRLVGCAKLVAHRLPGALAQTNIVANMLFGAMSGSGVAGCARMGCPGRITGLRSRNMTMPCTFPTWAGMSRSNSQR